MLGMTCMGQTTFGTDTVFFEDVTNEDQSSTPIPINPPADTTVPKLVFWIHGLAGDERSWERVNAATNDQGVHPVPGYPERWMLGKAETYTEFETNPLFNLATSYVDKIETWRETNGRDTLDPYQNIAIAHSQGGLVARSMRRNYLSTDPTIHRDVQYNALATFGSPHGGAWIINSTRPSNGDVQNWLIEGCEAIGPAEIQTFLFSEWWLDGIVSPSTIKKITGTTCSGLQSLVLPLLVDAIRKPVGADYGIGRPSLDTLRNLALADTMQVVTFYGIEEDPVFWRVLHSMTYTKDTTLSGSILFNDPFGLNADDEFPQLIDNRISDYRAWEQYYRNIVEDPLYWSFGANKKMEIYQDARKWLQGGNMWWKRFIGARRDSTYQNGYLCFCNNAVIPNWVSDPSYCTDQNGNPCNYTPHINHYIFEEASDGVVPVSSQIDYPGARIWRMDNTNHMQERNCLETRDRLNELFDGRHGKDFRLYKK